MGAHANCNRRTGVRNGRFFHDAFKEKSHCINPLQTNDAYMRHGSHKPIRIYMGGLMLGVNTLYRLFCFFKLFPMVSKGLTRAY